jgi:hypothetical protein
MMQIKHAFITFLLIFGFCHHSFGQDNYEIEVYESDIALPKETIFELHSNYTFGGQIQADDGVLPTHDMLHETICIAHGLTDWLEISGMLYSAIGNDNRTSLVGGHIASTVKAPEDWRFPVGFAIHVEGGYQDRMYSEDGQTLEIRPIIDKTFKNLYISINPTFEKSFQGANENKGFVFSPDAKSSYSISKLVALGFEYYGTLGVLSHFDPYQLQQHQLFAVADLNFSENWEFNCGYGLGFTRATDNAIFKMNIAYKFH